MVFSIVLNESCHSLHICKGECICREAFGIAMHSGHEPVLFAVTPETLEHFRPNPVKKQECGTAHLQTLMIIGHDGVHTLLPLMSVGRAVHSELTAVCEAHNFPISTRSNAAQDSAAHHDRIWS